MQLLELLFPRRCLGCGVGGETLCDACRSAAPRIVPPLCDRCGAPTAWPVRRCSECAGRRLAFAHARAALVYDGAVRRLVAAWKERGLRTVASLAADLVCLEVDVPDERATVTFVPPDRRRTLERGHHPAERLAAELAERWELPVAPLLGRTREVAAQRGLTLVARRRNVAGAFAAAADVPARVVLVDDVYTTGATASAAASALRRRGARRVEVVTLARAVR